MLPTGQNRRPSNSLFRSTVAQNSALQSNASQDAVFAAAALRARVNLTAFTLQYKVAACHWGENRMRKTCLHLAAIGVLMLLSGCASLGVKVWDRDLLARDDMRLDANPVDGAIDEHMYFSKEASSGGRSYAGGGCGCN
jgi:hypothetical protein